jgi:hypothetical protein
MQKLNLLSESEVRLHHFSTAWFCLIFLFTVVTNGIVVETITNVIVGISSVGMFQNRVARF